jgi:hypothetical protein
MPTLLAISLQLKLSEKTNIWMREFFLAENLNLGNNLGFFSQQRD